MPLVIGKEIFLILFVLRNRGYFSLRERLRCIDGAAGRFFLHLSPVCIAASSVKHFSFRYLQDKTRVIKKILSMLSTCGTIEPCGLLRAYVLLTWMLCGGRPKR